VIQDQAHFLAPGRLEAGSRELSFRAAIVATGSEPAVPPIPGLDDADALTTDSLWELRVLPRQLTVLGGGPVGCELAQAFARLGARVRLIEMADRLLVKEELDASALVAARLREDGVEVRLGQRALAVRGASEPDAAADGPAAPAHPHELALESPGGTEQLRYGRLLFAVGRTPRTAGLELERAGVQTDERGDVIVDRHLRTTARGIYAVGDVTGLQAFTHVAAHHARVATVNALFHARESVSDALPWVTFTDPEVGRVGLTEAQARARWGGRTIVAEHDYATLDRAITAGEAYGFAKLIGHPRGRLVGATVAAPGGGEAIAELTAWLSRGEKLAAVSRAVHAYPTLAEGPARAADAYLAARYSRPPVRALARAALAALRLTERWR
jgi:pyruvate/2-oxoglutarate dehydrogenase complex dihydrolipoamide dehydrogenase (E3) component